MKKKLSILFFLVTILYGYAQDEVSFVSDINPGIANSNPREFLVAEDFLWFIADNENGFVGAHRMDQQENILEFTSGVDAYGLESFQGAEYVILGDPFGRDFGSLYGLNSSPAGGLLSNTTIWGKELFAYGNQLYFSGEIDNPDVNNFRSANLISYDGTNAQQIPNPVGFPVGLNLEPRDFTLGSDGKIYFIGNDTNSTLAIYSFDGIQINSEVDNILISDYYVSSLTSFSNYVCYYDFAFVDYDLKSFNILNKENNTIGSFAYNPEAGLYDFNDYMYSGGSGGLASWNSDFTSNNLYGATYDLKKILGSFNNQLLQSSTFDNISFFPSKFFECGDFNTIREPVNNSTSDFNPLTGIEFNNKFYFSANDENSAIGQELYSYRTNYYCGDIFLSTQQEVEEFGAYNYIEIDGQVSIGGDDIVDLTSLTSWQTISGGLIIGNNINLSNLSGLNNLNEIGSFNNDYDISLILADNQNLNDLSAFQNLTQIDGLIIENNPVLASLEGLHNLVSTRDFFVIQNNDALTDFSGLRGLNGNGFINVFVIESNDNLTSLNGLQNFSPVVQTLSISNNLKIRSLAPLSGFTNEIGNGVSDLINNSKLTSFCGAFGLSSEPMTITGNAQNPTQAEIVSAGPCIYTSIPDDNFEAYLIAQNIDNEQIADNRILTSDATDALLLDLSGFDVSNFEGLQAFSNITSFSLINNQAAIVQEVNFSGNLLLETLTIINAPNVPSIDISQNNLINDLAIVTRGNLFSEIDLAGKNSITTLELADNQISTIDLNGTPNLTYLSLAINPLTQIDVTSLSALESISTYESQITTLDVSQNSNLTSINSDNGALTSVNIKNGFNNLLEFVEFNGNPGLNCILVDDVAFAEGQTISVTNPTGTWNKDNSSSYNEVSCNPITVEFLDDDIIGVESEQTDQQFVGLLVNGTITSNTTVTVSFISGDAIASPNTNADFSLGTNGQVTIDIPLGNYDGFSNPIFLSGFIDDNDPFEIIDDAIYEGNENLVLGITDFTGDITAVGTSSQLQYEIIDDDYVPRIRVVDGIASESATIDTAEFIFELTDGQGNLVPNDFYQDLFIEYAITGSAVETDDYQNLEQVLLTGVNAQSIFIFPEDDELTELTEDVILTVTRTGVLPFYQLGTTASTATVQILDNEIPGFTLSTIIVTTSEPNNSDSFTVVLNAQPVSDVVIDIASNNTAEAVTTPTSLTFTNANWDIPQTVTVNGQDDTIVDGTQNYVLTLSVNDAVSDDAYDAVADQTITGTNADDDITGTPGFILSENVVATSEPNGTDNFTVVLGLQPATDVVIDLASNNTAEAVTTPTSLTFTNANWNIPQTVTVTGQDDTILDGTQNYLINLSINDTASDDVYDAVADQTITGTNADDDITGTPGFILSENVVATSEPNGTDNFTVVLGLQPATDVVIDLASNNTAEAVTTPTSLTFTNANWDIPQTVTVNGQDDTIVDGTQNYVLTLSVNDAVSDDAYDAVADQTITGTNADDDITGTPGFILSENVVATSEPNGTDNFAVTLDIQPTTDVVIDITSNNTAEAVTTPTSLTFTNANWDIPQTVTVNGQDDTIVDGTQNYVLTLSVNDAVSDDAYDAVADQTITGTNADDDITGTPGFILSENVVATSEPNGTDNFAVTLDIQPTTDVVIDITSNNTAEAFTTPTFLTFTNANWNIPQTVTVTGQDDTIVDGTQNYVLTLSVNDAVSDDAYDAVADQTITGTNADDDITGTPGFILSENVVATSEPNGTDNFTVVLGLQPATDVVIDLASNNTAEAVTTPTFLTFTNANWNIPQTVTVTGQDDTVLDGTQNYLINLSINDAVSDDAYDTVADQTVTGTNTDDDNPITSPNLNQEDISIIITNATCADVNNGEILLETSSDFVFRVSLNSVGQNNTISLNTPLRISQLSKGAYTVCLTLDEFPNWEQCYSTSITNFEDLIAEVLEIDSTNQFAQISLQGSLSYEVNVNENNYDYQFSSTSKNTVKVPLASGENTIIIKGDSDCQGIFSQELIVGEIKYYPNPVKSVISINGISGENATYSIFDSSGSLVLSDNSKNQEFLIRINLESLSKGWYFLIITNEIGQYNFKILKE